MEQLASVVGTLHHRLRRTVQGPFAVASGLKGFASVLGGAGSGRGSGFSEATLLNCIDFKTAGSGTDRRVQDQIVQVAHKRAMTGDWGNWSADLDRAEQTLAQTSDGTRHHSLMMRGALRIVERAIERGEHPKARDALARIDSAAGDAPKDPMLTALAVRARLGLAKGGSTTDFPSPNTGEAAQFVEDAEALLAGVERVSGPVLAEARYRTAALAEAPGELLAGLYADWAESDPEDAAPMRLHGECLLTRCGGDLSAIELEARRAALRTEPVLGFAGYAMLSLPLLGSAPELCEVLDPALLVDGVDDWLSALPEPHLVNVVLADMWDLTQSRAPALAASEATRDLRDYVAESLPDLVQRHLRRISPDAWGDDLDRVRHVLANAYHAHLRSGGTLLLTAEGATLKPAAGRRVTDQRLVRQGLPAPAEPPAEREAPTESVGAL